MALISDAGTPAISDPGQRLVAAAHAAGVSVVPLPGPCAAVAALSASGLPSARFAFEGFLPARAAARQAALSALVRGTAHAYFLRGAAPPAGPAGRRGGTVFGDRPAALAKELTKVHEAVINGDAVSLKAWLLAEPGRERGEFVLIVQGAPEQAAASDDIDALLGRLLAVLPLKQAVTAAVAVSDAPRNRVYRRALALQAAPAQPTLAPAGSRTGNRARLDDLPRARKVRAPQDGVPGNAWGAQAYGKCHRKHTADGVARRTGKVEKVR